MIAEVLVLISLWSALALLIHFVFGLHIFVSVLVGLVLLVIYSFFAPSSNRPSDSQQRISAQSFLSFIRDLIFFICVSVMDIALLFFTIYIESGGAKLAFPNFSWPKEILAFFQLLGLPIPNPQIVYGIATSLIFAIGNYTMVRYILNFVGAVQRMTYARLRNQNEVIQQEFAQLIQPSFIIFILFLITYLVLFPWMIKVARLQLAKLFWPADFQVSSGEEITSVMQYPDLNFLLDKHRGEFYCILLMAFPALLIGAHILAAFLSEIYYLYLQTHSGQFFELHDRVVLTTRQYVERIFSAILEVIRNMYRGLREFLHSFLPQSPVAERRQPTIEEEVSIGEQQREQPEESFSRRVEEVDRREAQNSQESEQDAVEEISPEDIPVKVIGDSCYITPNEALKHPEIFVVIRKNGSDGNIGYYEVYTREFYEKITKERS